jgi:hypothetical protein
MRSMMHAAHTTPDQRPVLTGYAIQAGERSKRQNAAGAAADGMPFSTSRSGSRSACVLPATTPPMNADPRQSPDTI